MLKLSVLLGSLMLVYAFQERQSCINQPGLTYSPCPFRVGPRASVVSSTGGGPFTLLDCCKVTTYSGSGSINYEFRRGTWDLVILCATMETGKTVRIRPMNCDDGTCMHANIDNTATFPLRIAMRGPHFLFDSGSTFSVTFLATNNDAESECTCESSCQAGWVEYGDHCYLRTSTSGDFDTMEGQCSSLHDGAHLTSITSELEYAFLVNTFRTGASPDQFWIGLKDITLGEPVRDWRWADCSAYGYTNWKPGEPNNGGGWQDCVHITAVRNYNYRFSDVRCVESMDGICKYYRVPVTGADPKTLSCCSVEKYRGTDRACYRYNQGGQTTIVIQCAKMETGKTIKVRQYPCTETECDIDEIDENTVFPMTIAANIADDFIFYSDGYDFEVEFLVAKHDDSSCACPDSCETDWVKNGDYCYRRTSTTGAFFAMEEECHSLRAGAHLTSVNSAEEHTFIKDNFVIAGTEEDEFWIGVYDKMYGTSPRTWVWTDCTISSYMDWRTNQPDNTGDKEDCVHLRGNYNFQFNDAPCSRNIAAVCKYYTGYIA